MLHLLALLCGTTFLEFWKISIDFLIFKRKWGSWHWSSIIESYCTSQNHNFELLFWLTLFVYELIMITCRLHRTASRICLFTDHFTKDSNVKINYLSKVWYSNSINVQIWELVNNRVWWINKKKIGEKNLVYYVVAISCFAGHCPSTEKYYYFLIRCCNLQA